MSLDFEAERGGGRFTVFSSVAADSRPIAADRWW
jgi:hypothetical protein